jgi:hypothetical protein
MNSCEQPAGASPRIFYFRATQLGKYFHGYCAKVTAERRDVTLHDRKLVRYVFEPGETRPRVEVENAGPLTLLKKDFHVVATFVAPPSWFCPKN